MGCNTTRQTESSSDSHLDNHCADNPDLAPTTMRSREPELYKNGRTRRIRALARNLVNGKLPYANPTGYSSVWSGQNINIGGEKVQNEKIICSVRCLSRKLLWMRLCILMRWTSLALIFWCHAAVAGANWGTGNPVYMIDFMPTQWRWTQSLLPVHSCPLPSFLPYTFSLISHLNKFLCLAAFIFLSFKSLILIST